MPFGSELTSAFVWFSTHYFITPCTMLFLDIFFTNFTRIFLDLRRIVFKRFFFCFLWFFFQILFYYLLNRQSHAFACGPASPKVVPKVKRIISWLSISCCNSLTNFKLQVVDIMTFQTKLCTKSFIFFPKKLFYPIKTMFKLNKNFYSTLKNGFFLITHILAQSQTFID